MWLEEHLWNLCVLQRGHHSNLVMIVIVINFKLYKILLFAEVDIFSPTVLMIMIGFLNI
jgi:hypothetical protein